MARRQLAFNHFDEVIRNVEQLHAQGCQPAKNWNLTQVCDHLAYFIQSSMDGADFKVPWLLKTLFGRLALKRILSTRRMRENIPAPPVSRPVAGGDEATAVAKLKQQIQRFQSFRSELKPSPFFGPMTREQWSDLHLIHCAHHLSFLVPK